MTSPALDIDDGGLGGGVAGDERGEHGGEARPLRPGEPEHRIAGQLRQVSHHITSMCLAPISTSAKSTGWPLRLVYVLG